MSWYIIRADGTRNYTIAGDGVDIPDKVIVVPDLRLPPRAEWFAYEVFKGFHLRVKLDQKAATTVWLGPFAIGQGTYYVVDPGPWAVALANQLGPSNVSRWIVALRNSAAARSLAVDEGFTPVSNSSGVVYYIPPSGINGRPLRDYNLGDDQTIEDIPTLP